MIKQQAAGLPAARFIIISISHDRISACSSLLTAASDIIDGGEMCVEAISIAPESASAAAFLKYPFS